MLLIGLSAFGLHSNRWNNQIVISSRQCFHLHFCVNYHWLLFCANYSPGPGHIADEESLQDPISHRGPNSSSQLLSWCEEWSISTQISRCMGISKRKVAYFPQQGSRYVTYMKNGLMTIKSTMVSETWFSSLFVFIVTCTVKCTMYHSYD